MATAKRFAVYGAISAGIGYSTVDISGANLRETHLPPCRTTSEAGVFIIMAAFIVLNGVPLTANPWLLKKGKRKAMTFIGPNVLECAAYA